MLCRLNRPQLQRLMNRHRTKRRRWERLNSLSQASLTCRCRSRSRWTSMWTSTWLPKASLQALRLHWRHWNPIDSRRHSCSWVKKTEKLNPGRLSCPAKSWMPSTSISCGETSMTASSSKSSSSRNVPGSMTMGSGIPFPYWWRTQCLKQSWCSPRPSSGVACSVVSRRWRPRLRRSHRRPRQQSPAAQISVPHG